MPSFQQAVSNNTPRREFTTNFNDIVDNNNLFAGNYIIEIIDSIGCQQFEYFQVGQNSELSVNIDANTFGLTFLKPDNAFVLW